MFDSFKIQREIAAFFESRNVSSSHYTTYRVVALQDYKLDTARQAQVCVVELENPEALIPENGTWRARLAVSRDSRWEDDCAHQYQGMPDYEQEPTSLRWALTARMRELARQELESCFVLAVGAVDCSLEQEEDLLVETLSMDVWLQL